MKSVFITTALAAISLINPAEAAMEKEVNFESANQTLAGTLYLPDNYQEGQKLPAVVVTGAWTSVKEQMSKNYALALADQGYAALTFDFRGWGESEGAIKYLEDPVRKTEDIHAAVNYLLTRPEVEDQKIAGLGICASAGYMSDAAASNPNIKSLALVAPWLHNKDIVNTVYGGEEGVSNLIDISINAHKSGKPIYLEAASTSNEKALMYQAPYYTETHRGLIPEYDNKFNVESWEAWLTYDALKTADTQKKPSLLVHSEAAAIPQGAKEYARRAGKNARLIMLDEVTQFDFYDQAMPISTSVKAVDEHFQDTLSEAE